MAELSHLFSPIRIRNLTIRNRILQTAHITNFAVAGLPTERHVRYYEARAKGGIGLIIQEATIVSPYSQFHRVLSQGWNEQIKPRLAKIARAVHAHGAKLLLQLAHGGAICNSFYSWQNVQGCSPVPTPAMGEIPEQMDEQAIQTVIRLHVELTLNTRQAGYDGLELHFGHGYLQQHFTSPSYNIRKDAYGGSLEHRMRFGMQIIEAVREAAAKHFVAGLRMSADELRLHGYTLDQGREMARKWAGTGKIDFLNVSVACSASMAYPIPPMRVPPRYFVWCAADECASPATKAAGSAGPTRSRSHACRIRKRAAREC